MNLEGIWDWLKGKQHSLLAEVAAAMVLIVVLGAAGHGRQYGRGKFF